MTRRLLFLLFTVSVTVLSHSSPIAAEEPVLVTNWEIVGGLVHDSQAGNAIDLAPSQRDELHELFENKEILDRLKAERRRVQRQSIGIDVDLAVRLAQSRLDDEVRDRILLIIDCAQLRIARRYFVTQRYPTPIAVFEDSNLLRGCRVASLPPDFNKQLRAISKDLLSQAKELRLKSIRDVLQLIPESARQNFVNYAGNKYFPSLSPEPVDLKSLPYSARTRSTRMLTELLSPGELASSINLSADQKSKLQEANELYSSALSSVANGKHSVSEIRQRVEIESRRAEAALESVLRDEQLLKLYRMGALEEIELDLAVALRRPELIAYLQMTKEQNRQIYAAAVNANEPFQAEIRAVQQKSFEKLSKLLGPEANAKLVELFDGVWSDTQ